MAITPASAATNTPRVEVVRETLTGPTSNHVVQRWGIPIQVQVVKSTSVDQLVVIDGMIHEIEPLVAPVSITGVDEGGNVLVRIDSSNNLAKAGLLPPGTGGYTTVTFEDTDNTIHACSIVVADDPQTYLFHNPAMSTEDINRFLRFVLRHEMGHCLGLSHNSAAESVMSSIEGLWGPYTEYDQSLLRTLYGDKVQPGMNADQVAQALSQ